MEKAYLDENRREYELTKHISLRLHFPAAYLRLRTTGYCEISIPEWMFDLDYPGHYMRRIKNVTLTLPCVTGPYTGVHCRLTLLSSMTRIDPELRPPAHGCCCAGGREHSEYEPCRDDPRIVREYAARESIATSSGQNDSGLFELNFRDERYLPFEYSGRGQPVAHRAAAGEQLLRPGHAERPGPAPQLHRPRRRRRPARRGRAGRPRPAPRRRAAAVRRPPRLPRRLAGAARRPGGERRARPARDGRPRRLRLGFTPAMFPFVPGRRVRTIDRLLLMFAAPDADPGRHHLVRFWRDEADRDRVRRGRVRRRRRVARVLLRHGRPARAPARAAAGRPPGGLHVRDPRAGRGDLQRLRDRTLRRAGWPRCGSPDPAACCGSSAPAEG